MKVTIRDVAREAGVSAASVSLVLNDKPSRITDETKDKILRVAKELGYEPKSRKEEQEKPKDHVLGVINPEIDNAFVNQCIGGIESYASVHGYKTLICNVANSSERCISYLLLLSRLNVEGVIIIPPLDMNINDHNIKISEALKQTGMPFLLLDRAIDRVFCDFITADNKLGAYMATEHLILCGHEDIGIISGMREVYNSRKRIEGYKEALAFYNISIKSENIYYGDYRLPSGYAAADYFFRRGISAIFACNDEMAMGVYQYANENGLIIGEDISVVGYDDVPASARLTPPLTSIAQSCEQMGKKSCETIIKRITKEDKEAIRNIYFAPQFVERQSVKVLNK